MLLSKKRGGEREMEEKMLRGEKEGGGEEDLKASMFNIS
jgi:hypothetical protein